MVLIFNSNHFVIHREHLKYDVAKCRYVRMCIKKKLIQAPPFRDFLFFWSRGQPSIFVLEVKPLKDFGITCYHTCPRTELKRPFLYNFHSISP